MKRLKKFVATVGAVIIMGAFMAPSMAEPASPPGYGPTATLTANKPTKSGETVFYSAAAGSSTSLKASLRWQITGPDQTLNTVSRVGTFVSGTRICNWGIPRDRILYTRANSPAGQVDSATLWTTSTGSTC